MSLGNKEITLDGEGQICWTVASTELVAPAPIILNRWYKIAAMIDADGRMTLRVDQIRNSAGEESLTVEAKTDIAPALDGTLFLAARDRGGSWRSSSTAGLKRPLSVDGVVVERWNLADEMTSLCVPSALGAAGQELRLVNAPVRAVRCSLWEPVKCAGDTNLSIMQRCISMRMPSMILAGRPAFPRIAAIHAIWDLCDAHLQR